jgi:hypothetical protein
VKLKYHRTLAAAILAGIAFSASADVHVDSTEACPAGTFQNPSYHWENGHFVRDGWACQSYEGARAVG